MIVRVTGKDYLITEQFNLIIARDNMKELNDRKVEPEVKQPLPTEVSNRAVTGRDVSNNNSSRLLCFSNCSPTRSSRDNQPAAYIDAQYTELSAGPL
jgi:hypothetical protein